MSDALPTLQHLNEQLRSRKVSSEYLTREALERAEWPDGEGARTFIHLDRQGALAQARASDTLREAGIDLGPLMGLPISVKDLVDVKGQVTRAGSLVLASAPKASADAPIVTRLRRAGAVILGRTNMVEFAYSGLGLNPHYGTPRNPFERSLGRVPGGSSSGAAIAVTDRMCAASIGTDTGGSVRIPAAFCGLTGFKPTASRVPREGVLPLSVTLDSIGPLAPSVSCCATLDAVLADRAEIAHIAPRPLDRLRFLVAANILCDELDRDVATAFGRALSRISEAGAEVVEVAIAGIDTLYNEINPFASFSPAEAFAWHRQLLASHREKYDPRVAARIEKGAQLSAADYIDLIALRAAFMRSMNASLQGFDGLLMPTVACIAPLIAPLADDAQYWQANALVLRNTSMVNFLDGCAVTLPMHEPGAAPCGLSLAHVGHEDAHVLACGMSLEAVLSR